MRKLPSGPWRKDPHRVGEGAMLPRLLVAQCGMSMTEVPPAFWSLDEGAATVACPCGETVAVPEERLMFDGTLDCERGYIFDGETVYCINSPKVRPASTPAEPGVDVPEEPASS